MNLSYVHAISIFLAGMPCTCTFYSGIRNYETSVIQGKTNITKLSLLVVEPLRSGNPPPPPAPLDLSGSKPIIGNHLEMV